MMIQYVNVFVILFIKNLDVSDIFDSNDIKNRNKSLFVIIDKNEVKLQPTSFSNATERSWAITGNKINIFYSIFTDTNHFRSVKSYTGIEFNC